MINKLDLMRRSILAFVLLPMLCSPYLRAQKSYTFRQFGNETIDFVKQPTRWDGDDWLKLGLAGAGTFLVMQFDQMVRDAMMKDRSYYESTPIKIGKYWGDNYTTTIAAGVFALHGVLTETRSTKKVGFEIMQAALYSGGITTALKLAAGRARPYTNQGTSHYEPFTIMDDGYHSFPSGHTQLAFALSTVLSRNVDSPTLKVLAFVPAAMTAFSRIYQDYHWVSDCFVSAVIGYVVATWVVDLHDSKESPVHISGIYPLTIRIDLN